MNQMRTIDAAHGKWRGILLELGVPENFLINKHGPCPVCGGHKRFRFDDKDGTGSSICSQCGGRSGVQLAMDFLGETSFKATCDRIDSIVGTVKASPIRKGLTDEQQRAIRVSTWKSGHPIVKGDLADRYLTARRVDQLVYPVSLRFAPSLKDGEGGIRPAMLAVMQAPDGKAAAVHKTFLRPDGGAKAEMAAPRLITPGSIAEGAAVRLSEFSGGTLGIAEGIETALSASRLFDVPVWAALNATLMQKWTPPEGCDEVVIFADNDANHTGQAAAHTLARRLAMKGLATTVQVPPSEGDDWNDVLMKEKADA